MKTSIAPPNSDAYIESLDGWRKEYAEAIRAAVLEAATLHEAVKWGHLVFFSNGPSFSFGRRRIVFCSGSGAGSGCSASSRG